MRLHYIIIGLILVSLVLSFDASATTKISLGQINWTQSMPTSLNMGNYPILGTTLRGAIVYGSGSDIYGITASGTQVYHGSNATLALTYVMTNLTSGRTSQETVYTMGIQTFAGIIAIPSFTRIENMGKWIIAKNITQLDGTTGPNYRGSIMGSTPSTGNKDITINGGTIDNNDASDTTVSLTNIQNLVITNVNFTQPTIGHHGIITLRANGGQFSHNIVKNMWIVNIFDGPILIDGNDISGTHESGLSIGSATSLIKVQKVIVINNRINCTLSSHGAGMEFFGNVANCTSINNYVTGSWLSNLVISPDYPTLAFAPSDITVIGGSYSNSNRNDYHGIIVSGCSAHHTKNILIDGVTAFDNGNSIGRGIYIGGYIDGMTVTHCNFHDNKIGMSLMGADGIDQRIRITENNCNGNAVYGLHVNNNVYTPSQLMIKDNNFMNNTGTNYILAAGSLGADVKMSDNFY